MNDKKTSWQRTFEAFAGPGIHQTSSMMRVTESEVRTILGRLDALSWLASVYVGTGRHAGYSVSNARDTWATVLFYQGSIVGFYAGSYLWIGKQHRGLGLATPLIVAAADHRGGSVMPPGVSFQGYTPTGVLVHRAAHSHAVLTAVAAGLPVPAEVLEELQQEEGRFASLDRPSSCLS